MLDSSRHVKVSVNGEVVAETRRPKVLFETALPPRYYIPPEDVRIDRLVQTETQTGCPYKGVASSRSVEAGGKRVEDLVLGYPGPISAVEKIRDHLCLFDKKVDVEVDGEAQERPQTPWS